MLVVPNRRSYWANFGSTPFAHGTPYSVAQLKELLSDARFTISDIRNAFYAPPTSHAFWLRIWGVIERIGSLCIPGGGGVLIVEAEKQIYANIMEPSKSWVPAAAVKISAA